MDGTNPKKVLQRSAEPVLSWTDRPWMVGNSSQYLCYTPTVVFCNGARVVGGSRDGTGTGTAFELYFGAADAVVGSATVSVLTSIE